MKHTPRERQRLLVKRTLVVGLLTLAVAASTSILAMQSMGVKSATATELQHQNSKPLDVVIEINGTGDSRFTGSLLESVGNTDYRRTSTKLSFAIGAATKFIMGSKSDLHPGAVIDARGRVSKGTLTDVDRVVVLTGYAHVS